MMQGREEQGAAVDGLSVALQGMQLSGFPADLKAFMDTAHATLFNGVEESVLLSAGWIAVIEKYALGQLAELATTDALSVQDDGNYVVPNKQSLRGVLLHLFQHGFVNTVSQDVPPDELDVGEKQTSFVMKQAYYQAISGNPSKAEVDKFMGDPCEYIYLKAELLGIE